MPYFETLKPEEIDDPNTVEALIERIRALTDPRDQSPLIRDLRRVITWYIHGADPVAELVTEIELTSDNPRRQGELIQKLGQVLRERDEN